MGLLENHVDKVARKYGVAPVILAEAIIEEHVRTKVKPKRKLVDIPLDPIPENLMNRLRKIAKELHISLNSLIVGVTIHQAKKVILEAKLKKAYEKFNRDMFKAQCQEAEKLMVEEDKQRNAKSKKAIKSK